MMTFPDATSTNLPITRRPALSTHSSPSTHWTPSTCFGRFGPSRFATLTAAGFALVVTVALAGCGSQNPGGLEPGPVDAGPPATSRANEVAIFLDGREITIAEVDQHMQNQFMEEFARQSSDKQFELRENAAQDLVQSIVMGAEAKKRGISVDELFEEISNSVATPTTEEVATWFRENQSRLRGSSLEDVSGQVEQHLLNERRAQALEDFMSPKLEAMSWRMVLSPPRKEIEATRLARGKSDAPVTIITFSDYQCPYCILAEPVLDEVLERYPDQVRIVHRHFPLDSIHPYARPAAEASMCAEEQGKFWEYHQAIFDLSGKLLAGSLAKIGSDLGLDADKLNSCIEERRFKDFVESDFLAGRAAGVTGTPSFFINGITFTGARDADTMSQQIDRELARIEGS